MRQALLLCAVLIGSGSQVFADELEFQSDNSPPIHFHHTHPLIVIRQGLKPISIQAGLTPLDKGNYPINCGSASGCIVTAKTTVTMINMEYPNLSAYVDGVAMNPPSLLTGPSTFVVQQSGLVGPGPHKLQSQLSQTTKQGTIVGWDAEYAVYPLK